LLNLQPILCKKLRHFSNEKVSENFGLFLYVLLNKLLKNRQIGENSPNLVTLAPNLVSNFDEVLRSGLKREVCSYFEINKCHTKKTLADSRMLTSRVALNQKWLDFVGS
jgi:hypothetical protein